MARKTKDFWLFGDIFGVGLSDRKIWLEIDVSNRDFRQLIGVLKLFCVWFFSFVQHVCVCPASSHTIFSSDSCNLLSFFGTGYNIEQKRLEKNDVCHATDVVAKMKEHPYTGHFSHTVDDLGWLDFSLQLIIFTFYQLTISFGRASLRLPKCFIRFIWTV